MRLQWLDYLAMLRERKTWLCAAALLYATLAIPTLLERPPPHVRDAITTWFSSSDPFVLFMYIWIDLTMNKIIAFAPVVLGSGLVLWERDIGVLPLIAAKPLSMSRYFVLRTLSACGVMATLHIATQLIGLVYFTARVPGFRAGTFLGAMSLHLFAAIFATALVAAIASLVKRRGAAALLGFAVLSLLVGLALVGFYQPAWRAAARFNPIALGSLALGHLDQLGPAVLLPPMLALSILSCLFIAIGAIAVRHMEG
jgi:ABC-2 type transport system permease protein